MSSRIRAYGRLGWNSTWWGAKLRLSGSCRSSPVDNSSTRTWPAFGNSWLLAGDEDVKTTADCPPGATAKPAACGSPSTFVVGPNCCRFVVGPVQARSRFEDDCTLKDTAVSLSP